MSIREMISFLEAFEAITSNISPLASEKVMLRNLLVRVVYEYIASPFNSPSSEGIEMIPSGSTVDVQVLKFPSAF